MIEEKSWGTLETLIDSIDKKQYKILLYPNQHTNYHLHQECDENHNVLQGKCVFILDGVLRHCKEGDSLHISKKTKHCILNTGDCSLILIETKSGKFFAGDTSWYNDEVANIIEKLKNTEIL